MPMKMCASEEEEKKKKKSKQVEILVMCVRKELFHCQIRRG